jgi:hypothetical protein
MDHLDSKLAGPAYCAADQLHLVSAASQLGRHPKLQYSAANWGFRDDQAEATHLVAVLEEKTVLSEGQSWLAQHLLKRLPAQGTAPFAPTATRLDKIQERRQSVAGEVPDAQEEVLAIRR